MKEKLELIVSIIKNKKGERNEANFNPVWCQDSARDVPIEVASQLAHRHNGQITGIFYPRLPDPVIVDPMSGGVVSYDGLDEEIEAQKNSAGDLIRQRAAACNPRIGDKQLIVDMTSLSNWRQVGEICRVYDVSIIGRSNENPHWQTLFEMALFEGGRPVLVVPFMGRENLVKP